MTRAKESSPAGVPADHAYVEAMLGLQVWAHTLHQAIHAAAHEGPAHQHQ